MKMHAIRRKSLLSVFSVIFLFLLAFFFVSCTSSEEEAKKLSAPENVRVEHRVVYWDEVENADYYVITVNNGEKFETTECQFPLDYYIFNQNGKYQFNVFAKSKSDKYQDSAYNYAIVTLQAPKAYGKDEHGFQYTWVEELNGYQVAKGSAILPETLVIPDYFEDYPVKKIEPYGFTTRKPGIGGPIPTWWNEYLCNTETKKIQLPKSLEVISNHAFSCITRMEEVVIPDTVTHIEEWAFESCARLKKVAFSKQLKEIGAYAFYRTALDAMELPEGLEVIESWAFSSGRNPGDIDYVYSALSRVVFPASVKKIDLGILLGRENLTEIVFEDLSSVEDIRMDSLPEWWYENNGEVIDGVYYIGKVLMETREDFQTKEFTVPSHVKLIRSFDGRGVVEKLYIPDGVNLDFSLKNGFENLKEIRLPADLMGGLGAGNFFWNTPNLEKVVIPEGVVTLHLDFNKASGIKELTVFTKIKLGVQIKNPAASKLYCPDLTTINYQGVAYTYSAEKPTEEGNYWYVDKDGYFEIWT